jgi:hypothetical protein
MTSALSPAALLQAWETAEGRSALDRPLVLLWAAGGGADFADRPLAERDRALLALRRATFGDEMVCMTDCPACGERLEMAVSAAALAEALPLAEPEALTAAGQSMTVRPLSSRDVALAASAPGDPETALVRLASTCEGEASPAALAVAAERLQEIQAAAELHFSLTCGACGEVWAEVLDVAAYVWAEVRTAAHRLLGEVAEIARALGWSEQEILALSPARRAAYLQIARSG